MPIINSIILIDDDQVYNVINEKVIYQASFAIRIKAFKSAEMALKELWETLDEHPDDFPQVIFLDINMPGMNGWEFLEGYKAMPEEITRHCFLCMLTSSIDPADEAKAATYKMIGDFISKPLTSEKLLKLENKIRGNMSMN